jgi:predicted protein tyrosine phosphatase
MSFSSSSSSSSSSAAKRQKISACGDKLLVEQNGSLVQFSRAGLHPLIVCAETDVSVGTLQTMAQLRERLDGMRVKTILNVTENAATEAVRTMMEEDLGIAYHHYSVIETALLDDDFFQVVADHYFTHLTLSTNTAHSAFLVHCMAGHNRSGIAMAALLWLTAPEDDEKDVATILKCMRAANSNFVKQDKYILPLRIWTGEIKVSKRFLSAGAGKKMRENVRAAMLSKK